MLPRWAEENILLTLNVWMLVYESFKFWIMFESRLNAVALVFMSSNMLGL